MLRLFRQAATRVLAAFSGKTSAFADTICCDQFRFIQELHAMGESVYDLDDTRLLEALDPPIQDGCNIPISFYNS
jgi:hypothetical protein